MLNSTSYYVLSQPDSELDRSASFLISATILAIAPRENKERKKRKKNPLPLLLLLFPSFFFAKGNLESTSLHVLRTVEIFTFYFSTCSPRRKQSLVFGGFFSDISSMQKSNTFLNTASGEYKMYLVVCKPRIRRGHHGLAACK